MVTRHGSWITSVFSACDAVQSELSIGWPHSRLSRDPYQRSPYFTERIRKTVRRFDAERWWKKVDLSKKKCFWTVPFSAFACMACDLLALRSDELLRSGLWRFHPGLRICKYCNGIKTELSLCWGICRSTCSLQTEDGTEKCRDVKRVIQNIEVSE